MADFTFHPEASTDYVQALRWYANRIRKAARGFENEVERVTAILAGNPMRYPECDAGCREAALTRYPYSLVYRIEPHESIFVALEHPSREPGYWANRTR